MNFWRTAPTAISEASIMLLMGASASGRKRRVTVAGVSSIVLKALAVTLF